MYKELPCFLGGDTEAAGDHLKKATSLDVPYAPARLDLGKWYLNQVILKRSQPNSIEYLNHLDSRNDGFGSVFINRNRKFCGHKYGR
jgi:hypothetical protein